MRKVLLLSSVLFLSGCTLQFGYNNIDWLVHWYVDDYVDLDREQRKQFDTQMEKFLAWHRDNELPRYRSQLTELQQQVKSGSVSSEQWLDHLTRVRQHWWQSRDEMAELMVPLANTLSDKQVAALFDELKDQNEESREEELAETPEQDREERFERMIERLETWYGQFDSNQIVMLETYIEDYESTYLLRMDYRERFQQAAADLMKGRQAEPDVVPGLIAMIKNPQPYQGEQLITSRQNRTEAFADFMAQLDRSLTPYQRQHFIDEVQDMVDDIDQLLLPTYKERMNAT